MQSQGAVSNDSWAKNGTGKGMRQIDLANEMGYSPALVGNYEKEGLSNLIKVL